MSIELSILRAFCLEKQNFVDYNPYIALLTKKDMILRNLFKLVGEYYKKYPDTNDLDMDNFKGWYDYTYPNARDREVYLDRIEETFKKDVNADLMRDSVEQYIEKYYSNQIVTMLMPTLEGNKFDVLHKIQPLLEEYTGLLHNPPDEVKILKPLNMTVKELTEHVLLNTGYKFPIKRMNAVIGGMRPKSNGLIYGYVDSGKTSFTMSLAACVAEQMIGTDECILYLGNEEAKERLGIRATMAFTHFNDERIIRETRLAQKIQDEKGASHLKIFDEVDTGDQILKLMDEYHPAVVVIDQATDVEIKFGKDNEGVGWLKQLLKWYRRLGNTYETSVVGVAQATGEAEDRDYLRLGDIYGSRVGIQGGLDWACGIGQLLDEEKDESIRFLNIPKNKYGSKGKCKCYFDHETNEWTQHKGG